jgi:hypothetical protein
MGMAPYPAREPAERNETRSPKEKEMSQIKWLTSIAMFSVVVFGLGTRSAAAQSLKVDVQTSRGTAIPGNNVPATILVLVSEELTGVPVTNLNRDNFVVVNYGDGTPGLCGFTENVVTFSSAGNGAYRLAVAPRDCAAPSGPTWVGATYLIGVSVRPSATVFRGYGQGAGKLVVVKPSRRQ